MKIRTALPLMFALGFLMLPISNSNAQINSAYPYDVAFTLDAASISHDFVETNIKPDTIRGTIEDRSNFGNVEMTVSITSARQWVISAKINGNPVYGGENVELGQGGILPVEVVIVPYGEKPDTESYCLTFTLRSDPKYILNQKCISLALTDNSKSAVSPDLPTPNITLSPNPASNFISLLGLGDMQAIRYEIYSVSGSEVRHGSLPADARIGVQDLSSGAYGLILFDTKQLFFNTAFTVLH